MNEALAMCLVCVLLAVIVWRAPGFAADLLAASPSLSAGAVGQHVTSAVSTAATMIGGTVAGGLAASKMINAAKSSASPNAAGRVGGGGGAHGGGARGTLQTLTAAVPGGAKTNGTSASTGSPGGSTLPPAAQNKTRA